MLRSEAATWFVWHWLKTVDICTPRETAEYCCLLRRSYFLFSFQSFTSFVLYQQFFGRVFILVIFIVNFFDRHIKNFVPLHNCIELVTNCTWKIEAKTFCIWFLSKKLFFFSFQPKSKKKKNELNRVSECACEVICYKNWEGREWPKRIFGLTGN